MLGDDGAEQARAILASGSYSVASPANDDVWIGHERVIGSFRVAGITAGFWRDVDVAVDGTLTDAQREVLSGAVADRFLLWSGRDLHRQPLFDAAFAGAALSRDKGWIVIEDGPFEAVRLKQGRIVAVRHQAGGVSRYTWDEVEEQLVVIERKQGRERILTS